MQSAPGMNQRWGTLILCSTAFLQSSTKLRNGLEPLQVPRATSASAAPRDFLTALPPHTLPPHLPSSNGRQDDEARPRGQAGQHSWPGSDLESTLTH